MNISGIVDEIHISQEQAEKHRMNIKDLYTRLNDGLSESNGVITKNVENLYKEIDAEFGKKTKLEQKIATAKRRMLAEMGIE